MTTEVSIYRLSRLSWLVLMLSSIIFMASCTNGPREVSQKRFTQMVQDEEVERVTIINNQWAEIRLTPNASASVKYSYLFDDQQQREKSKPHFQIEIVSEQAFRNDLAKIHPTFPIVTEKRSLFSFRP